MPQQIGSAGTRATAWAEHILRSPDPQVGRARELKEFAKRLRSLLFGPGEPLEVTTRERMEAFLGYDLEKVRIYRGQGAEEASRQLNARAFTFRGRIFAPRQSLDTSTAEGVGLLAHELTHAIQQTQPQRLPQSRAADQGAGAAPAAPAGGRAEVGMVLLAPASAPSANGPQLSEAQAQASERLAAEALADNRPESPPEISNEAVADRVYRLMQYDLVLERERAT